MRREPQRERQKYIMRLPIVEIVWKGTFAAIVAVLFIRWPRHILESKFGRPGYLVMLRGWRWLQTSGVIVRLLGVRWITLFLPMGSRDNDSDKVKINRYGVLWTHTKLTQSVCRGNFRAVADCFCDNDSYDDVFYGEFKGKKNIEDLIDFRSDIRDPVSFYREVANTYLLYSVLGFQKHVWQNSLLNTVRA